MRFFWLLILSATLATASPIDDFISEARTKHGESGARAAQFLVEHMPDSDRSSLSTEFLIDNLDLAFQARSEFPWAKQVPEAIFLNDVLPYAVFDEKRDPWRKEFYQMARGLVKDSKTATEAVQTLNRQLFNLVKVHYNTGRKRPNQSPKESMELGMATCTGLSIILVDACRSIGIPARAVGTPLWANLRGNHTWVEIWDGDWHFTGADEYDKKGLNRGWFVGDAAQAKANEPRHAIYATSWKREGLTFPMVWARTNKEVASVNVTARYAKSTEPKPAESLVGVRLFDKKAGKRIPAGVSLSLVDGQPAGQGTTKAGTADLNDMPRFSLKPGSRGWARFRIGNQTREMAFGPTTAGETTLDAFWDQLGKVSPAIAALEQWVALPQAARDEQSRVLRRTLSQADASRALQLLAANRTTQLATERKSELDQRTIEFQGKSLRWLSKTFGEPPSEGRSLWISMHGGGNAPAAVNDRQWTNQIGLYQPAEGIYVAPRAPTDTWNLWHEGHIDPLFQRLIENYVVLQGVNPNKVYLMGYSAGGDGVWQLAPRMADRFAAAAMMAGHPNEASLLGLRNLPFAVFMGGNDSAYGRNKIAADRSAQLDQLAKQDPEGYPHMSRIYEGLGHWMNRKDAEALPWMAQFQRRAWPKRIVWVQDDVLHDRFYWLQLPADVKAKAKQQIIATVEGQSIRIDGDVPDRLILRLSDELVDLNSSIQVIIQGKKAFSGKVKRRAEHLLADLEDRFDPTMAASAYLTVKKPLR
ncbi:MAG: dienelactone hydrolase family protein [Verrucomicrobiales bacterium]|nr:dienelactone hydrolase family protein [Verrucomicrobiales bacterium]